MENFTAFQHYPSFQYELVQAPPGCIQTPTPLAMYSFGMNPYPIHYYIPPNIIHPPQWQYLLSPLQPSLYNVNPNYQFPPNSPSNEMAPRPPPSPENPPTQQPVSESDDVVRETEAIKALEYYFSIGNVSSDWYLRKLMDSNLWVSLEDILPFRRMKLYGIRTLEQLQELAIKTSTVTECTNVVLDKSNLFVRPKWADWSEIKIRENFANRNMKRAKRKKLVRKAIEKALDSITLRREILRETIRPKITLFARAKDGVFTASFNVPGVPSLIVPFLKNYEIKEGRMCVIKTTDSLFTEDFFSINRLPHK